jgi:DnaJ domain/Domain of unknown function (DUF4388)/Tetratricopeptide repeat
VATKGSFALKSFAELLAEIYRWRSTGALLIRRENVKKIIYFRDGTAQLVKSNLLVECLGRILVREKMISEAECEESLKRMKSSKRMQGTVLVEMGALSPHNLQYALEMQVQEKLFDAFRWETGEYQFNPTVDPPPDPLSLNLTCAQLIYQGIQKSWDDVRMRGVLDPLENLYVHPAEDPLYALQDAGLGEEEAEFMKLVDGHKTVATLRALGVLEPRETDRLIIAMRAAQMISLKDVRAAGKPRLSFADFAARAPASNPPIDIEENLLEAPPPLPPRSSLSPPPFPSDGKAPAQDAPPVSAPRAPAFELPWDAAHVAHSPPSAPKPLAPRPVLAAQKENRSSLLPELSGLTKMPSFSDLEGDLRERLVAKWAIMRGLDYFQILGVDRSASREDIKRAYFSLAREYHPDKHSQSSSAEVAQLMKQIYDLISSAHDCLTDSSERAAYLKTLEAGVQREDNVDVTQILAAEGRFQRGEALMGERRFVEAIRCFKEAIEFYPAEGEFHAWLGWGLFQAEPNRGDDAVRHLEHALTLNPKLDKSYLFLGYVQKSIGRPDKAEKQFEKAIQCNPDCTEALRELRLLNRTKR